MTKAETLLAQAKVGLIRSQPFFASILLRRPVELTESVPTACVNAKAEIKVNPKFIEKMTVRQIMFLLCHEVLHVAGLHFMRQGWREHEKWNWATDAWINETLKQDRNIGDFIPGGVQYNGAQASTSEELYSKAPEDVKSQMNGGIGMDLPDNNGSSDDPSNDPNSAQGKALATEIKIAVAQAAAIAKAQGKLPGALQQFCDELIAEHVPWYEVLAQYMETMVPSPIQSWSKRNKRFAPQGIYLPGQYKEPQMDFLVVQLDVSGSITHELMSKYVNHIENIIDQVNPKKLLVLWVDTRVQRTQLLEWPNREPIDHFVTFGGTDMEYGFTWLDENEPDTPDAMIIITDGETSFTKSPGFPVIWCIDNGYRDVVPPYGTTIKINEK